MWEVILDKVATRYGSSSIDRVKRMLIPTRRDRERRHPLQARAQYVLPDLSEEMIISLEKYPDLMRARDHFMRSHSRIRGEIQEYLERIGRPEVHGGYDKLGGEKWRAVFLNRLGRNIDDVTRFFPETMSHIKDCTEMLFPIGGISFSLLEAGAYIAPHSDRTNVFIHFHQSVVTPPDCGLKVGGNEIVFEEKLSYLFDPSFVHEAWNRSSRSRINLILPVWHPDTTPPEREALTDVFKMLRELRDN